MSKRVKKCTRLIDWNSGHAILKVFFRFFNDFEKNYYSIKIIDSRSHHYPIHMEIELDLILVWNMAKNRTRETLKIYFIGFYETPQPLWIIWPNRRESGVPLRYSQVWQQYQYFSSYRFNKYRFVPTGSPISVEIFSDIKRL